MSDAPAGTTVPRATTAGGLLRQARQAQGLHIAALAAAIKVVPRKLELLEADQYDQLPDATFTRALAQAVCRTLKVDAAPVLALLPPPNGHRLEQVSEGLKTPFHERPGRLKPQDWATGLSSPVLWLAALLLLGAIVVYVLPAGWLPKGQASAPSSSASAPAEQAASAPSIGFASAPEESPSDSVPVAATGTASGRSEPALTTVAPTIDPASAAPPSTRGAGLRVSATAPSWVGVVDARGKSLVSRLVQPAESLDLDGTPPFTLTIGNASAARIVFRGQPVALAPFTRDNVARLELK